jgi:hypothetical protein
MEHDALVNDGKMLSSAPLFFTYLRLTEYHKKLRFYHRKGLNKKGQSRLRLENVSTPIFVRLRLSQ